MGKTYLRGARVVLVLALALGGYFLLIESSHVDRKRLHELVIGRTSLAALAGRRPSISQSVPASQSSFSVVRKAAKTDADRTGLYEQEWYLSSSAPPQVGFLLVLMPDEGTATAAFDDSVRLLSKPPSLEGQTGTEPTRFRVRSVPGSSAIAYLLKSSSGRAGGYTYTVDFRLGRVVVSELTVTSETRFSTSQATEDAQRESALLRRVEPGFSLTVTTFPVVSSVVYTIVAAAIAVGSFFVPEIAADGLDRRRARREAKELERVRSQYRARGRRAVQRHKAPAWRQPGRR